MGEKEGGTSIAKVISGQFYSSASSALTGISIGDTCTRVEGSAAGVAACAEPVGDLG